MALPRPARRFLLTAGLRREPLFYRDSERVVFGSEIKSIHRHPRVPREPNLEALPYYLTYGYFPAPSRPIVVSSL